jgi:hypothetical protein
MMKRLWLIACMAMLPAALSAQTPPEGTRGPDAQQFAPTYNTVEGQPIESRKPNSPNEVPAFWARPARLITRTHLGSCDFQLNF